MRVDGPHAVADQCTTEDHLAARRAFYEHADGPDPRELAFEAVAEIQRRRVLRADVVMVDISPRMVELARARGVNARVADVQQLPFADGAFDCAVAAWMVFHVPDLDRGVGELARVVRPRGRLVAATNGLEHLRALRELAGSAAWHRPFTRENGADVLGRHFASVERRDADGWVSIDDEAVIRRYVDSLAPHVAPELPSLSVPLRARTATSVFVATR